MAADPRIALLCTSPGWGGLESNTLRLAQLLIGEGWQVTTIVAEGSRMEKAFADASLPTKALAAPQGWAGRKRAADAVVSLLREQLIPVLLTPFNKDIALAARCQRKLKGALRVVYQQHMKVGVPKRDLIHTRRYKALDAWIAPLPYLKDETLRLTKVPDSKIHIIPFGLPTEKIHHRGPDRASARAAAGLPADELIIGVLGRIDPKKGQDFVIRALHTWNTRYASEPAHLLIQGDPTAEEGDAYLDTCRSLVVGLGLTEFVHFRGHSADIGTFFSAIDVFAMPALGETYGMVTLEAMAAFVPVIGTDTDGTRALLAEGTFGYLFELENTDHFCTQLRAMLSNGQLPEMLRLAHERVRLEFAEEECFRKTGSLLRQLAG